VSLGKKNFGTGFDGVRVMQPAKTLILYGEGAILAVGIEQRSPSDISPRLG